ncbi:MAG: hypothetical protein COU09_01215 [Candidatus Harrisonbacteria bacterium CG10_big_fil_rev_8_21_14_0_10_44_23]|uniref:Uncharacterized protein n=1 Tax=Candidatus Harrisonbacteria bacterium CG10_big_fil_rev_8_21_14_0_10_44_23 TaxID=1974585 RepID=A0A2H0USE8_9BACT|nr:MAG: hypothetical protein COU09_01215 [Candidatus Harrisonbacteria bacterium CG10_big_fil_rev_8_21_14_0_10_44_23]
MFIFLTGPDTYRRDRELRKIVQAFKEKHPNAPILDCDLKEVDGSESLRDALTSFGLFSPKKLIRLINPEEASKEDIKMLKSATDKKDAIIIINQDKTTPPKGFNFLKKVPTLTYHFEKLGGDKLFSFVLEEAKKRGLSLSKSKTQNIINLCAADTWAIINEVEQLSLGGRDKAGSLNGGNFFGLIMSLNSPNSSVEQKLRILEELSVSSDPAMVFNILASLSRDKSKMADYDVLIKSGKLEYPEVLLDFALKQK